MSMCHRVGLRLAVASALGVAASGTLQAQDSGSTMILEEIVVTAEKREEKLQDVPVAVSAYTDAVRDIVGIRSVEDVAAFTPGMNFSSLDRMSIRGIGRLTNALGSDPGVATYNDGFYTSSLAEAGKSQLFVERVEVLRGPQGTLYGRNSMGGAVNVISKRPSRDEFEGEVRAIFANYDSKHLEGSFSGPISDSFRFRLLGQSNNRDEGYFENLSGPDRYRTERELVELQLEADLGDSVQWWLKYSSANWNDGNSDGNLNGVQIDPYYAGGGVFPTGSLVPNGAFLAAVNGRTNPGATDRYTIDENTPASYQLDDNHTFVTHLTFDFGATALKYVGGYQQYDFTLTQDYDGTGLTGPVTSFPASPTVTVPFVTPVYPDYVSEFIDNKQYYSNELNLSSNGDGPHTWIFGLYQFHEKVENPVSLYAPNQPQLGAPRDRTTFVPVAASPNNRFYFAQGALETDSYAAFGQFDYAVNENWTATIGVRYTRDEKVGVESHRLIYFLPIAPALGGTGPIALDVSPAINNRTLEGEWDNVSGKLGLEWAPSEAAMFYANYNRGYKSGGFNLGTIIGGANTAAATVDEEIVDAFELGWKTNLTDSFQFNGAMFYYLYDNAQVPFGEFRNGINTVTFRNTDVTSYGLELETLWAATDNLSFLLNYSYLNAEVTRECQYRGVNDFSDCYYDTADPQAIAVGANRVGQDTAGNWLQSLDGNSVPQAPENKIAFNANYRVDFGAGSLTFSGSYTWQDEVGYSLFGNEAYRVEDFGLADFRMIWAGGDNRYTIIGFVENALDDEGYNAASVSARSFGAVRTWNFLAPRTYGVELQVRF